MFSRSKILNRDNSRVQELSYRQCWTLAARTETHIVFRFAYPPNSRRSCLQVTSVSLGTSGLLPSASRSPTFSNYRRTQPRQSETESMRRGTCHFFVGPRAMGHNRKGQLAHWFGVSLFCVVGPSREPTPHTLWPTPSTKGPPYCFQMIKCKTFEKI